MVPLNAYLVVAVALFTLGFAGVVLRRNLLIALMSLELMLNGVNLAFVTFARSWGDVAGHVTAFFVIVLAAAEAAVGLAIVILIFRRRGTVMSTEITQLKDAIRVD